jgi:isoleucyl-tRNA synthetase
MNARSSIVDPSELNSLLRRYYEYMDAYDVTKAARSVSSFTVDQLSNWYVRRNRRRFWKSEMGKDKLAAYQTLYDCLVCVTKLMAPFAPFLADELYRNLESGAGSDTSASVHLAMMPPVDESVIDRTLELRMERAEQVVMLVRAMRMRANLKVRQPLKRIILPIASEDERLMLEHVEDVILDEVNVKSMEYVTDESGLVKKKAKANFKSIGPKFERMFKALPDGSKNGWGEIDQLERSAA